MKTKTLTTLTKFDPPDVENCSFVCRRHFCRWPLVPVGGARQSVRTNSLKLANLRPTSTFSKLAFSGFLGGSEDIPVFFGAHI